MRSAATLTVTSGGTSAWLVAGELDAATAPQLQAIVSPAHGDIELHCAGVTFVDAAGINVFVELHHRCASHGTHLVIVDPSPFVARLLSLTGVDTVVDVRRSEDAAHE